MFTKILVPLDAAQDAETALPLAEVLAKQLDEELVLLSVLPEDTEFAHMPGDYGAAIAGFIETRRKFAATYLDRIRERVLRNGVPASSTIAVGPIARTILDTARSEGAGLIAMATHGRVGPERWFLGSVADQVARTSEVPVLLVRPGESVATHAEVPTNIIVPLDGSPLAEGALPIATALATAFKAPITLVRTVPIGLWSMDGEMYAGALEIIAAVEDDAKNYLAKTAADLRARGLQVTTQFALFGAPDMEIEAAVGGNRQPLVVMTSHGRSGLGRVVLGSVADRVARSSSAPVLIVRGAPQA